MKLSLTLLATLVFTSLASAQTPQNPVVITTAPYVINASGYYRLGDNLSYSAASGNIVTINVSNVTLDLNGFFISGPAGNTSQTTSGIYAQNRSNLVIFNGTVANCSIGVNIVGGSNSRNTRITNMRISNCSTAGIYDTTPVGHLIADNQITDIGYTAASGGRYGIYVESGSVAIRGNQVANIIAANTADTWGIYCFGGAAHFVVRNLVNNCGTGVRMNNATGNKYQDNLTASVTTAFTGGQDAGGNN